LKDYPCVNPDCPNRAPLPSAPQASEFCALCDLEHALHEDAQGFHHVIKGERVACQVGSTDREALAGPNYIDEIAQPRAPELRHHANETLEEQEYLKQSAADGDDRKFANGLSMKEYWKIRDEMTADTTVSRPHRGGAVE
jgi:hypothetical protein